ncbi:MAG: hypothetical protein Kow0027_07680 [Saprospiraceae bacterium]
MNRSVFELDYQNQDPDSKIVSALERIGSAFRALLWKDSLPLAISPIQAQILIFVLTHKDVYCTVSYLASEFNMTKPTLSEAVRSLESKGLVQKVPLPKDRRILTIHLTEEGEKTAALASQYTATTLNVVKNLGPGCDKENLLLTLIELINQFQQLGIISVQRMCFNCSHYRKDHDGHPHYCQLLGQALANTELRIDCPEFEEAAISTS